MKYNFLLFVMVCLLAFVSCKKDDEKSCTTCNSAETSSFQVCEERDGNASVNGQNTQTPFAIYLQGLEEAGATCGN